MELLWIIFAFLLLILGLVGCFLPLLPGPPVSFLGLLVLHYLGGHPFSSYLLWIYAILSLSSLILDYYLPIWTTQKYGGSKAGQWGATFGVLLGLFVGPWGVILGPFVGAYIGELLAGRKSQEAWHSAKGAFVGFLLGTGLKMMLVGGMIWSAIHHI